MVTATVSLLSGHLEVSAESDEHGVSAVTLLRYGPRGSYIASLSTEPGLAQLLERAYKARNLQGELRISRVQPLADGGRALVVRGNGSEIQLHTTTARIPDWGRNTIGVPLISLAVEDLPAVARAIDAATKSSSR
jgi:hypothetical protein